MCSRGVYQLSRLSMFFCDWSGSSQGVRRYLSSPLYNQFIADNPQIQVQLFIKRNHHPYVKGEYINGYSKDVPLRNEDDQAVHEYLTKLRNQLGRSALSASGTRVYNSIKSIQGKWQPNMFNSVPQATLEKVYSIPEPIITGIEKPVYNNVPKGKIDRANIALTTRRIRKGIN